MAAPSFFDKQFINSTGGLNFTMPANVLTNDVILLLLETRNQAVTISTSGTGLSWTEVTGSPITSGSTRLTAFWARSSQDSPGNPSTADSGDHTNGLLLVYRGVRTSGNPWVDTPVTSTDGSDTTVSISGVTTTVDNCLMVYALASDGPDANNTSQFSSEANANLTGLVERHDQHTVSGLGGGLGVWEGVLATAGASGSLTATKSNASSKAQICIPLAPPVVVSTTVKNLASLGVG